MVLIPESLMVVLFCSSLISFSSLYYGGIAILFCNYLSDTCNNILGGTVFSVSINRHFRTFIGYLVPHNLWIILNPIIDILFYIWIDFLFFLGLLILYHKSLLVHIDLRFVLSAANLWKADFCFTYNSAKN